MSEFIEHMVQSYCAENRTTYHRHLILLLYDVLSFGIINYMAYNDAYYPEAN